jgi:hypothetical protein
MSALRNPFRKTAKTVTKTVASSGSIMDESTHRIKKIVLTGGPCGGKSSGMSHISEFLRGELCAAADSF